MQLEISIYLVSPSRALPTRHSYLFSYAKKGSWAGGWATAGDHVRSGMAAKQVSMSSRHLMAFRHDCAAYGLWLMSDGLWLRPGLSLRLWLRLWLWLWLSAKPASYLLLMLLDAHHEVHGPFDRSSSSGSGGGSGNDDVRLKSASVKVFFSRCKIYTRWKGAADCIYILSWAHTHVRIRAELAALWVAQCCSICRWLLLLRLL